MKIVTFGCQNSIHVYYDDCGLIPNSPYKSHNTISDASIHLMQRGVFNPDIIEYKKEEINVAGGFWAIPNDKNNKGILKYKK